MTKFIVYEKKWLRGKDKSVLLNDKGERCCMGFLGQQCGIPDEAMLNISDFAGLDKKWWDKLPEDLRPVDEHSEFNWPHGDKAGAIYNENDEGKITDEVRKKYLDESFGVAGVEVEFKP